MLWRHPSIYFYKNTTWVAFHEYHSGNIIQVIRRNIVWKMSRELKIAIEIHRKMHIHIPVLYYLFITSLLSHLSLYPKLKYNAVAHANPSRLSSLSEKLLGDEFYTSLFPFQRFVLNFNDQSWMGIFFHELSHNSPFIISIWTILIFLIAFWFY